jgi:hypothetical protein
LNEPELACLNIHLYNDGDDRYLDIRDITAVQHLVGRVKGGADEWAIIDNSGTLTQTTYSAEESPME